MDYNEARSQVRKAWGHLRSSSELQGIPDEILDLMKESALEKIDKYEQEIIINAPGYMKVNAGSVEIPD